MYPNTIVIGAGIGGLAIAAALARTGTAVTVLEQAAQIADVGAGIQITPNSLGILRTLGLEAKLSRFAVRAEAVVLENDRGKEVATVQLSPLKEDPYRFVHRADLIALLVQSAKENNVSFELGQKVQQIIPGEIPQILLQDGTRRQAKLVICADGLHSVGRPLLNGPAPAQFTGQVAWRAIVPMTDKPPPIARVAMGNRRHLVRYPIRNGTMMNIVAVEEREGWASEGWMHQDRRENLVSAFASFQGPIPNLLAQVEQVHLWGLFQHPVAERWIKDNVVLLGDAAHPMLPFLAQGANMALEDAAVLLQSIKSQNLARYQELRKPRVEKVAKAAAGNAWKYHLPPGPRRAVAHVGLRLISTCAPKMLSRSFNWLYKYDPVKAFKG